MDIGELARRAKAYRLEINDIKHRLAPSDFTWYPYDTLSNFVLLDRLLTRKNRNLLELAEGGPIADIGAADGDTAFFLETLGHRTHAVDYPPTNFNSCRGLRLLRDSLGSSVEIREVDLDRSFELPGERYGLSFFLGILYHLKNPFGALESLARLSRYAVLSTRVVRYNLSRKGKGSSATNRERVELHTVPVGYLVAPDETNNDATNYWMFSEAGLRRILDRTGWNVLDYTTFGNDRASDPATTDGDERAFCLLQSRNI